MFELVNNVVGIYKQHIKGKLNSLRSITFNGRTSKETRLQSMLNSLKGLLLKAQSTLEDTSSGVKGFLVGFSSFDPEQYKPMVEKGILILDEFNKTVFQKPLSKKILTRIDATTAKLFEASKGVGKEIWTECPYYKLILGKKCQLIYRCSIWYKEQSEILAGI